MTSQHVETAQGSASGTADFQQVMAKLESLSNRLEDLVNGQQMVESYIRSIAQELGTSPKSGQSVGRTASMDTRDTNILGNLSLVHVPSDRPEASGGLSRVNRVASLTLEPSTPSRSAVQWTTTHAAGRRIVTVHHNVSPSSPSSHSPHGGHMGLGSVGLASTIPGDDENVGEQAWEQGFWQRKDITQLKSGDDSLAKQRRFGLILSKSRGPDTEVEPKKLKPLHPDSWKRAAFDLVSLLLLLYDSVMIPYQIAWNLPYTGWLAATSWVTLLFWTVDMLLGFVTGIYWKDRVVMDFKGIAKIYLKSGRFFLNLMVVLADLGSNILETFSIGGLQNEKMLIKLLRFLKLERVSKLSMVCQQGKVAQALDAVNTFMRQRGAHEQWNLIVRVCKLVCFIIWVNHLVCCLWYMIGEEAMTSWAIENELAHMGLRGRGNQTRSGLRPGDMADGFEYMLGFYWAASVLVSGGSIMTPRTIWELLMSVFCVVFGFIFTSVLISSLLGAVIDYQEANKERYDKLTTLRQFLYQHKVDSRISVPLVKQANLRMGRSKRLAEGDVDALLLLSQNMRSELWYEIYGPSIGAHPYIAALDAVNEGLTKEICYGAMHQATLEPGERVFQAKEEAKGAFFVYHGFLDYTPLSSDGCQYHDLRSFSWEARTSAQHSPDFDPLVAKKGMWISEVALWAHWLHRGFLDATSKSQLLIVQVENFIKLIAKRPKLIPILKAYSKSVLKALELEPSEGVSDLMNPVAHHSVVAAMPLEERVALSQGAVSVMVRSGKWSGAISEDKGLQELKKEVDEGECDLMVLADANVRRVVTIVALQLVRRHDRAVLTQIGKMSDGKRMGSCQPPGTKVKEGEHARKAIERLMKQKLTGLVESINVGCSSNDSEDRVSKKYGVPSTYMRTLYEGIFDESDDQYMQVLTRAAGGIAKGSSTSSSTSSGQQNNATASTSVTSAGARTASMAITSARSIHIRGSTAAFYDPTRSYEAFVFRDELEKKPGTLFFYAWLSKEDFDVLQDPSHASKLQGWVDALIFPDDSRRATPRADGIEQSQSLRSPRQVVFSEGVEEQDGREGA